MNHRKHSILGLMGFLSLIGMKWSSVLFTDARGQLGKQVVGGAWKGRPYFRAYVTPTNPNSLKQQAQRDWNTQALTFYQAYIGSDSNYVTIWNSSALSRLISGYNLFMLLARKNIISVVTAPGAPGHATLTVTYTCGADLSDTYILSTTDHAIFTERKTPATIQPGEDNEFTIDVTSTDKVYIYFGRSSIKTLFGEGWARKMLCGHWSADNDNGVAVAAEVTPVLGA